MLGHRPLHFEKLNCCITIIMYAIKVCKLHYCLTVISTMTSLLAWAHAFSYQVQVCFTMVWTHYYFWQRAFCWHSLSVVHMCIYDYFGKTDFWVRHALCFFSPVTNPIPVTCISKFKNHDLQKSCCLWAEQEPCSKCVPAICTQLQQTC